MGAELASILLEAGQEWPGVEGSLPLLGVILLASLGTGILFAISLLAWYQRRSRRYLIIAIAVGALFSRTLVGMGTVFGVVPMVVHHLVEHSLDFSIAALLLYAVIRSKPTQFGTNELEEPAPQED